MEVLTGWTRIGPLVSLAVAGIVLWGTWGLPRDSVGMSLDAVPEGITLDGVREFLL